MFNSTSTEPDIAQAAATDTTSMTTSATTSSKTVETVQPSTSTESTSTSVAVAPTPATTATPTTIPPAPPPTPQTTAPPQPVVTSPTIVPAAPHTTLPQQQQPRPQPTGTSSPTSTETPHVVPPDSTSAAPHDAPKTTAVPSFITITLTPTSPGDSTIITVVQTSTHAGNANSGSATDSSSSPASTAELQNDTPGGSSAGLTGGGKIAVAVVVPIVAATLLVLALLFLFRRRNQRKHAEELRRKEVEEYGYNPNQDPTFPVIETNEGHPENEMQEETAGYRGWGTTAPTLVRDSSIAMSGNSYSAATGIGLAYSEGESPTHATMSDTKSDNALISEHTVLNEEQDPIRHTVPVTGKNPSGDINREASNASSSYSAANISDECTEVNGRYNNNSYNPQSYEMEAPYDTTTGRAEMAAQPVIRDVQARRNTRIESPSHFPQQSAGISQNF